MADETQGLSGMVNAIWGAIAGLLGGGGAATAMSRAKSEKVAVHDTQIRRLEDQAEKNTEAHEVLARQGTETATTLGYLRDDVHDIKKSVSKLATATQEIATRGH